ncbi:MAG TPA: hypothetical protein VLH10_18605 [Yinghuangia sp.]|uniref:hypothetical protein n=1 Tax=Yinghuangia sp. YIM S10712 TaxID=3436930 RepID=UPI002BC6DC88|nr:hypothetical protein [Yinghuangia sp.]
MTSPDTRCGPCGADIRARTADDMFVEPLVGAFAALPAMRDAMTEHRRAARDFDATGRSPGVPSARAGGAPAAESGSDAELRALTLLTNRTSTRTSASGGPALPLRDGVRVYLEGLPDTAAAAYAHPVADLAEAEVAVLRVDAPQGTGITDDDTDRVLDIAAAVPTVVVLHVDGPCPAPEFTDDCAALLVDLGAADQTVLDVVFGRHAPLGRLVFPLGAPHEPEFPAGFGLAY